MDFIITHDSKGIEFKPVNKYYQLISDGAVEICHPLNWTHNLIAIVENISDEVIQYIPDDETFEILNKSRNVRFILYVHAKELSGYSKHINSQNKPKSKKRHRWKKC